MNQNINEAAKMRTATYRISTTDEVMRQFNDLEIEITRWITDPEPGIYEASDLPLVYVSSVSNPHHQMTLSPDDLSPRPEVPAAHRNLLRINVRQVAVRLDDPLDEEAAGIYAVSFDFDVTDLSDQKRASIALDIFHAHQGIECLDDFAIDVIDSTGNPVGQDEEHKDYSHSDAGDVEKVSNTPVHIEDGKVKQVGTVPIYDPFEVLANLVKWAGHMGGWEAPCWDEAAQLLERRRQAALQITAAIADRGATVRIKPGCSEDDQLDSFQNGTLQPFGKKLAVTIQTTIKVPAALEESSEEAAVEYLGNLLQLASDATDSKLMFDVQIGPNSDQIDESSEGQDD